MNMNTIINHIPSAFRHKLLTSADALLNSKWCRMVKDPAVRTRLLEWAEEWLSSKGKGTPVVSLLKKVVTALRELQGRKYLWSTGNALLLAGAVLYTLSPLDAVPDLLPCIGWLDDLALLLMCLRYIGAAPEEKPLPQAATNSGISPQTAA